ncbi:unnamed protein product [Ectocarpus sp. 13 AM-2016]
MSGEEVAKAFLTHFYSKFANNGAQLDQLGALYQPTSMLTIEGNQVVGATNIVAKYKDLGGNLQFQPDTLDVQMGTTTSALLAVVTGKLKVGQDAEEAPGPSFAARYPHSEEDAKIKSARLSESSRRDGPNAFHHFRDQCWSFPRSSQALKTGQGCVVPYGNLRDWC